MDSFPKKLKRILKEAYPPPDKVQLREDKGIIGKIVSDRFKGLEPMDRVNMIWDFLEERLTKDEIRQIVIMLAMTPKEELLHSLT